MIKSNFLNVVCDISTYLTRFCKQEHSIFLLLSELIITRFEFSTFTERLIITKLKSKSKDYRFFFNTQYFEEKLPLFATFNVRSAWGNYRWYSVKIELYFLYKNQIICYLFYHVTWIENLANYMYIVLLCVINYFLWDVIDNIFIHRLLFVVRIKRISPYLTYISRTNKHKMIKKCVYVLVVWTGKLSDNRSKHMA